MNPEMGGAEVFTREVLKRWATAGHAVTLFAAEFKGCKSKETVDGIEILRKGGKYTVYHNAKKCYGTSLSKEQYDIVIDEINTEPFMTPKFVKNGEKVFALIHQLAREYWFYETPFPISYFGYYILEKRWLKNYRTIPTITVSESSRKDLADMGFTRIFKVGEGLNFKPLEKVAAKENHPVAVFAGRLTKAKRPDYAIKAFEIVKSRIPDAELWIIGNGYFRETLKKRAFRGVEFFDNVTTDERRELIKKAWLLVNPSVREGFGLNIVEANALGVPCVAYDVAGLRDAIIHKETGLLVESGNINALAEGIIQVLTDEALRVRLSEEALEYSRDFSWDKVADDFLNIIRAA
jgi:glycosyltransferase involved in cell wall biosynthesis